MKKKNLLLDLTKQGRTASVVDQISISEAESPNKNPIFEIILGLNISV